MFITQNNKLLIDILIVKVNYHIISLLFIMNLLLEEMTHVGYVDNLMILKNLFYINIIIIFCF